MPAANASIAASARAFVDAELATDGFLGDVDLELFVDVVVLVDRAAAMGAASGSGASRVSSMVSGSGTGR
jgi:hypothetical protein